ncbi:helix-turn-helix domain-containing protein [Gryllotalpicola daejeonensis]|uniref:winged helix-turn-helix transcriptional regulator n=1 Tax=Gryllotalpicola daejeonensis TaxID=993087 RepID=UPI0031D4B4EC
MSGGDGASDGAGVDQGSDDARASGLGAALEVVGARWALLIAERLLDGPQRYGDLQRELGVPTNVLATRLRELEAAGVLRRLPLKHNTRAYALTDRGLALSEAIEALARWGDGEG